MGKDGKSMFVGVLRLEGEHLRLQTADPARAFDLPLHRFPGARGSVRRRMATSADGTVLLGARDGSLLAVDISGQPLYQLGVRGAVLDIKSRPEGGFSVTTVSGEVILDKALGAPREPALTKVAPIQYLAEPPLHGEAPDIVLSPKEAWRFRTENDVREGLRRFDGKTWTEVRVPELTGPRTWRPGASDFSPEVLRRGPKGQLLLIGTQNVWNSAGPAIDTFTLRVLEWNGKVFRDRADIKPAYEATTANTYLSEASDPINHVVGEGGRELFCLDVNCIARGLSSSFDYADVEQAEKTKAPGWFHFPWSDSGASVGRRAMAFAGDNLFRFDHHSLSRNGAEIMRSRALYQALHEGKYPLAPDPFGPARDLPMYNVQEDVVVHGAWTAGPNDMWLSAGQYGHESALFRWNGKELVPVPRPMAWIDDIWGSGPDDVWFSGDAVAHYDGHEITRIPGIPPGRIVGGASGDVWIHDWHVVRAPAPSPDLAGTPAETPPVAAPSEALEPTAEGPRLKAETVTLKIPGEPPLTAALGVEEGPNGLVWLHDRARIVELEGDAARVLYRAKGAEMLDCQRCVSPRAPGEGVFLVGGPDRMTGLREIAKGAVTDVRWTPDLLALATAPSGDIWAVSAAEDHGVARALVRTKSGLRNVTGLPIAAYSNLTIRATDDVWLTGGLTAYNDGSRTQPAGEGILVHYDGKAFTRYRGPEGALLSVAAVGPSEAWAVGHGGGIVHVKGGVVTAYHLERAGKPWTAALRAVAATGPDDVWISGDGSTLIHFDGKAFSKVDVASVGMDAALTAVVPPRDKNAGWLAGPRGIWRLTRTDKGAGHGQ